MKKRIIYTFIYALTAFIIPFAAEMFVSFGDMLLLTQITVMLCGFMLGAASGAACGILTALMRHFILWLPYSGEDAVLLGAELCVFGLVPGLIYSVLPKKISSLYAAVIITLAVCTAVRACGTYFLPGAGDVPKYLRSILRYIPGVILMLAAVPPAVLTVKFKKVR